MPVAHPLPAAVTIKTLSVPWGERSPPHLLMKNQYNNINDIHGYHCRYERIFLITVFFGSLQCRKLLAECERTEKAFDNNIYL